MCQNVSRQKLICLKKGFIALVQYSHSMHLNHLICDKNYFIFHVIVLKTFKNNPSPFFFQIVFHSQQELEEN